MNRWKSNPTTAGTRIFRSWSGSSRATSSGDATRLFLATGILGAFTTFSTFSLDFAHLYQRGSWLLCALYVLASVILSIGALFAGIGLARRWLAP